MAATRKRPVDKDMNLDSRAPLISVVIPVLNGVSTIARQLDALRHQTAPPDFEVIVSDNGSTDGTVGLVSRIAEDWPELRVLTTAVRPGASAARNAGVAAARAAAIAFCDADDVVGSGWLAAVNRGLEEYDLVTGPTEYDLLNSRRTADGRGRAGVDAAPLIGGGPLLSYAFGHNIGVRKSVAVNVGGFDESLLGGGDDVDFAWRVQLAGGLFGWIPEALVHYRVRPSLRALFKQMQRYSAAHDAVYGKHPSLWPAPPYRIGLTGIVRRGLPQIAKWRSVSDLWTTTRDLGWAAGRYRRREGSKVKTSRTFLRIPQPVDPHHRARGRLVVTATQLLEFVEPAHLVLRKRSSTGATPPLVVVGVYRKKNAAVVRRLVDSLGSGTQTAWWGLDGVADTLATVTAGSGPGVRLGLLNKLVDYLEPSPESWIVVADDDWTFVRGSFEDLVRGAVAVDFDLAQPAHAIGSHINWNITRHRLGTLARRGRFVEQGPVFALSPRARRRILPFPADIGMGWGVEALWWGETGLELGVIDGVTVRHRVPVGRGGYDTVQEWAQAMRMVEATGHSNWTEMQPDLGRWYWWQKRPSWVGQRKEEGPIDLESE